MVLKQTNWIDVQDVGISSPNQQNPHLKLLPPCLLAPLVLALEQFRLSACLFASLSCYACCWRTFCNHVAKCFVVVCAFGARPCQARSFKLA